MSEYYTGVSGTYMPPNSNFTLTRCIVRGNINLGNIKSCDDDIKHLTRDEAPARYKT